MARPVVLAKALVAASANAICLAQSGVGGTSLLINGATAVAGQAGFFGTPPTSAVLDTQRRVLITSAGNDSAITWTVQGTNDNGAPINCVVTGGNAVAVATPIDFATVSAVIPSAATASTVQVGTNGTGSTPWVRFNPHLSPSVLELAMEFTGTATASAEYTNDEFMSPIPSPVANGAPAAAYAPASPNPVALGVGTLTAITANADARLDNPMLGWRLTITAGQGSVQLTGIQAGIAGN